MYNVCNIDEMTNHSVGSLFYIAHRPDVSSSKFPNFAPKILFSKNVLTSRLIINLARILSISDDNAIGKSLKIDHPPLQAWLRPYLL